MSALYHVGYSDQVVSQCLHVSQPGQCLPPVKMRHSTISTDIV